MGAFLFPGQGSQAVGMGADIYESYPHIRHYFDDAESILGFNLKKVMFEGPDNELRRTQVTQPALFVHSVALAVLAGEAGLDPEATAGHSLGEFSATVSAGVLDFEEGLQVVKVRGQEMGKAGETVPGAMAAILNATDDQIETICQRAGESGVAVPANLNAPGQVVLSGSVEAIDQAIAIAQELGIRRAIKLNVSGAFHSPLMTPAREPLAAVLERVHFRSAKVPVYQNVTAKATTSEKEIRANLLDQLEQPVRWDAAIRQMAADGYTQFYEVGQGKVLQGLNRRIIPDAVTVGLSSAQDIQTLHV